MSTEIHRWHHHRKGQIMGTVEWEDETWMRIRLTGDHTLRYYSEANRGRVDEHDELLTVRKTLVTLID